MPPWTEHSSCRTQGQQHPGFLPFSTASAFLSPTLHGDTPPQLGPMDLGLPFPCQAQRKVWETWILQDLLVAGGLSRDSCLIQG